MIWAILAIAFAILVGGVIGFFIGGNDVEKFYNKQLLELIAICKELNALFEKNILQFDTYVANAEREKEAYGKECAEKAVADYMAAHVQPIQAEVKEEDVEFVKEPEIPSPLSFAEIEESFDPEIEELPLEEKPSDMEPDMTGWPDGKKEFYRSLCAVKEYREKFLRVKPETTFTGGKYVRIQPRFQFWLARLARQSHDKMTVAELINNILNEHFSDNISEVRHISEDLYELDHYDWES